MKRILILQAHNDDCAAELAHIDTIAQLFRMESCTLELRDIEDFKVSVCITGDYDYIYLAAHASPEGFGDAEKGIAISWDDLAYALCETDCMKAGAVLFLACCRGGLQRVARVLFTSCGQIDYVCGPRWTVTEDDITTGFHVFLYNMEVRREQPSVAAKRASLATNYDFFCYDRVELEDDMEREAMKQQIDQI